MGEEVGEGVGNGVGEEIGFTHSVTHSVTHSITSCPTPLQIFIFYKGAQCQYMSKHTSRGTPTPRDLFFTGARGASNGARGART